MQYTWSVPQDLAGPRHADGRATPPPPTKLETFFSALNATRNAPTTGPATSRRVGAVGIRLLRRAGRRPSATVRAIADSEYADAPVDEPGNDDLGAISSWYVWAALGLYPVTPGTGDLALASPLFPTVSVLLPDGHRLVEHAAAASAYDPYVHSLTVTGVARPAPAPSCSAAPPATRSTSTASSTPWTQPWLPASVLTSGGVLTYGLSSRPDPSWGDRPRCGPSLLRHRASPGRRLLAAERGDQRGRGADHRRPTRRRRRAAGRLGGALERRRCRADRHPEQRPAGGGRRLPVVDHRVIDHPHRRRCHPGKLRARRHHGGRRWHAAPAGGRRRPGHRLTQCGAPARSCLGHACADNPC